MKTNMISKAMGISSLILLSVLSGCASQTPKPSESPAEQIISLNNRAALSLLQTHEMGRATLSTTAPIVISTIVNLANLNESSNLGKLISEHISTQLTQAGYTVLEMKLKNSISMKDTSGELVLSRNAQEVAKTYKAQAVVAGTYIMSSNTAFVNVKLLNPIDGTAISGTSYAIPLTGHTGLDTK